MSGWGHPLLKANLRFPVSRFLDLADDELVKSVPSVSKLASNNGWPCFAFPSADGTAGARTSVSARWACLAS
jgi:hypothetical protein